LGFMAVSLFFMLKEKFSTPPPDFIISQCTELNALISKHQPIFDRLVYDKDTKEEILNNCKDVDLTPTQDILYMNSILKTEGGGVIEDSPMPFSFVSEYGSNLDYYTSLKPEKKGNWRTTLSKDISYVWSCLDVTETKLKKVALGNRGDTRDKVERDITTEMCFQTRPTWVSWKNYCVSAKNNYLKGDHFMLSDTDESAAERCGEDGEIWMRDRMDAAGKRFFSGIDKIADALSPEAFEKAKSSSYCKPPYIQTLGIKPLYC
jgi:hypothetical protein